VPIAKNDFERCTVVCLRYYQVYSSVVQLRIRMQPKRLFSRAVLYRQVHELLRGIGDCQMSSFSSLRNALPKKIKNNLKTAR